MGSRKQKKTVEKFKSRKEIRKDKRLQKKANRVHFQKRKKELKLERKERFQQKNKSQNKKDNTSDKIKSIKNIVPSDEIEDDFIDTAGDYDDEDEEIESDFELSDEELEMQTKAMSKQQESSKLKKPLTQLEMDHQRLKAQENSLRKDMNKQRVKQLKLFNKVEDKTIRRLEKLLKLDKNKSKRDVPKMFHDGLDYALEVCLPENMEKMYAAAKERANADLLSDDEWQEDFALATGELGEDSVDNIEPESKKSKQTNKKQKVKEVKEKPIELKKISSKQVEIVNSDLSKVDSECEDIESGSDEEDIDFGENVIESDSDNEAPEEVQTVTKSSRKAKLEKEVKRKEIPMESEHEEEGSFVDSESVDFDDDDNDSEMSGSENQPPNKVAKKSVAINSNGESDYKLGSAFDVSNAEEEQEKLDIWEDIYGRKRDKQGNIIKEESNEAPGTGKYIPPPLRARLQADANGTSNGQDDDPKRKDKLMRLKKLLKGLMNRLSEANMHKISTEIDNLFMRNSRNDMNVTLASLMNDALISKALAPERMVMEHALLIAALHANVGTEVGAYLLESLVDRFHQMIENGIQQYEVEDKTLDNVILLLCQMYTFRIFHHRLIYELLNRLVNDFCEKSVECVLLTLRSVGFSLRKDNSADLKALIIKIQKKTSEAPENLKSNARLKYMLDVLTAVKNNNVNRIPNYDPTLAEHMRKILKTLCTNGKYVTTLNISLDDLVNVQQRGKWWVVGSAWTGNINDIAAATKSTTIKKSEQKFSEKLLELARKQKMNTDERRNVFCVLMSAEDYIDAFEKLLHLAIKDHRVIISVIIHCCLADKTFNPYYAVVTQRFCDYDRKYLLATQFSLWDRIKQLPSLKKEQLTNLAQLILYLVTNSALPISVLKVIEFGELEKMTLRLVRQILLGILLGKEDTCKEIFQRIAPSSKLKSFKDGIHLFMHHFLLKGGTKSGVAEDKLNLLKKRISIADKSLDTSTIRF